MVSDADGRRRPTRLDPLVLFGVFPICWIGHDGFLSSWSYRIPLCCSLPSVVTSSSASCRTVSAQPVPLRFARESLPSPLCPPPQTRVARRPGQYSSSRTVQVTRL